MSDRDVRAVMVAIVGEAEIALDSRRRSTGPHGPPLPRGMVLVNEKAMGAVEAAIKALRGMAVQESEELKARVVPGIMLDGSAPLLTDFCPVLEDEPEAARPDPMARFAGLEIA